MVAVTDSEYWSAFGRNVVRRQPISAADLVRDLHALARRYAYVRDIYQYVGHCILRRFAISLALFALPGLMLWIVQRRHLTSAWWVVATVVVAMANHWFGERTALFFVRHTFGLASLEAAEQLTANRPHRECE